jgi:hypothetical protein
MIFYEVSKIDGAPKFGAGLVLADGQLVCGIRFVREQAVVTYH